MLCTNDVLLRNNAVALRAKVCYDLICGGFPFVYFAVFVYKEHAGRQAVISAVLSVMAVVLSVL